jgi:hypothetical protein
MDKNYKVLELIKTIEGLKLKKINDELLDKLTKPVSEETLEEALEGEPEKFSEIRNCCVIAATGQDKRQRYEAAKQLIEFFPDKQLYVSSMIMDKIRVIVLTSEDSPCWQVVDQMPENIKTYKGEKGIEYFIVQ